jgi:hypothetical protein
MMIERPASAPLLKTKERRVTDIKNIGMNMFFVLRSYQAAESELAEEIGSDLELIRQGFMSGSEFEKRSNLRRLARELRRRDDMPSRDEAWLWSNLWGSISGDTSDRVKS